MHGTTCICGHGHTCCRRRSNVSLPSTHTQLCTHYTTTMQVAHSSNVTITNCLCRSNVRDIKHDMHPNHRLHTNSVEDKHPLGLAIIQLILQMTRSSVPWISREVEISYCVVIIVFPCDAQLEMLSKRLLTLYPLKQGLRLLTTVSCRLVGRGKLPKGRILIFLQWQWLYNTYILYSSTSQPGMYST